MSQKDKIKSTKKRKEAIEDKTPTFNSALSLLKDKPIKSDTLVKKPCRDIQNTVEDPMPVKDLAQVITLLERLQASIDRLIVMLLEEGLRDSLQDDE